MHRPSSLSEAYLTPTPASTCVAVRVGGGRAPGALAGLDGAGGVVCGQNEQNVRALGLVVTGSGEGVPRMGGDAARRQRGCNGCSWARDGDGTEHSEA